MNILDQILNVKRQEVRKIQEFGLIETFPEKRSLKDALSKPEISIIAEIKLKSPSEGEIFSKADPVQIAKDYESAGADAISVVTDYLFFGGSLDILRAVSEAVTIPVMRKDFIIDQKQIQESHHYSADAFLLIAEALDGEDISSSIRFGKSLNLEALVEFHSEENADIVANLAPEIVGVNCRDLKTMTTDMTYFERMALSLPSNSVKVAESGIKTNDDLKYVSNLGYDAVLVGTSLMKTGNPGKALESLIRSRS